MPPVARAKTDKPILAVTMGDPAGIGPEIIVKALSSPAVHRVCRPVVVGDASVLGESLRFGPQGLSVRPIEHLDRLAPSSRQIDVLDLGLLRPGQVRPGIPGKKAGKAAVEYITEAADLASSRLVAGIVTAPINKEIIHAAGYEFSGHTELLARLTKTRHYGMMLVGGGLRVLLATIHMPLKKAISSLTVEKVHEKILLAHRAMLALGIRRPRIALAGLNPHAGEGGLFGKEESTILEPAVLKARRIGIEVSDPLPPDTVFYWAKEGRYDVVVALYHDQGLIPVKVLSFGQAVNVTVGLPFVRTSVDHGTAYDIAGKGKADPRSLLAAIQTAAELASTSASRKSG